MSIHRERNRRRAEHFGFAEPEVEEVEEEKAEEPELSMDNTKAELLEAAAGLDVDESNTKAEILEALNGTE